MKKFNLILASIFTLFTLNLTAQLAINLVPGENDCSAGNIELNLNDEVDLVMEENCEYITDFSNVQEGNNILSISSDLSLSISSGFSLDAGLSTFDLVLFAQHLIAINEFSSYAQAIAADIDNDRVISTDDFILLRQIILFELVEIEEPVKIGSLDLLTEPFEGFELRSNHTTYTFDKEDVQDGVNEDLLIIKVGDLDRSF